MQIVLMWGFALPKQWPGATAAQERSTVVVFFPSLSSTHFHFREPCLQNSSGTRKAVQGSQHNFQLGMKSNCKPTKQFFYLLSNKGHYILFHFQRHLCLSRNTKISQQSQTILSEAHSCTASMPDCLQLQLFQSQEIFPKNSKEDFQKSGVGFCVCVCVFCFFALYLFWLVGLVCFLLQWYI